MPFPYFSYIQKKYDITFIGSFRYDWENMSSGHIIMNCAEAQTNCQLTNYEVYYAHITYWGYGTIR